MNLEDKLLEYIKEEFSVSDIDWETGLVTTGVIDSFGILELISYIEQQYGFSIEEKDMIIDNFQSVKAVANLIRRNKT